MKKDKSIEESIIKLKKQKNAVILAHNYQIDEVQDIADFVGDSLQLSIEASRTRAGIIVFCGVHFMAETAKIISPEKKVLIPDENAGCPMADMINENELLHLKKRHPDAVVVCYVNSTAAVKALSDICCTSSNAVKIVNSIPRDKKIIFIPDKYLGSYVQSQTNRDMILWNGYCPTHVRINFKDLISLKKEHLDAVVLVHPETTTEITKAADKVLSTGQMLKFVKKSDKKEFIIGTEIGILHQLEIENPDKIFYPAYEKAICPDMKLINNEKILWSLQDEIYEIILPEEIIKKAKTAIDRMLSLS
ncbi:MAG: quinolinate synthase NadA [Actinobacteria bacterium]|nr:quinolinate synthase NadA [Actinomycetota bacterium]